MGCAAILQPRRISAKSLSGSPARHFPDSFPDSGFMCMKPGMKRFFSCVLGLLAVCLPALPAAAQTGTVTFNRSSLVIVTESGRHVFDVELAVAPQQRMQGLMFRRSMAREAGMLFDFGAHPQRASMWMKNTFIPLDMLFITADGRVESIAERTVPLSPEGIPSRGPVRGVLELNGGTVSRLGIKPGDLVEHPMFGTAE